jgi:hypothetical protein
VILVADVSLTQLYSIFINIQASDLVYGKELGRGAFGIVYKGRWRFTDVAIKVIQGTPSPTDLRLGDATVFLFVFLLTIIVWQYIPRRNATHDVTPTPQKCGAIAWCVPFSTLRCN